MIFRGLFFSYNAEIGRKDHKSTGSYMEMAPVVAETMAAELGNDQAWIYEQVEAYTELAKGYLL